ALSALPCGQLATKLGNRKAMMIGFGGLIVAAGVTSVLGSAGVAVLVAIAIGIAFSLVANGTLPYALSMVPPAKAGLGTGLYFSGGAAAMSVLSSIGPANLGLTVSLLAAAISFAVAAGCVAAKQP
ncbi:MFS transporter, partial [Leptolyngbya cf. ectocarpi LEGE 11479]|nr:MFS transporter [Leptolyngbya cf. ectocarpi LEGE 11479]